ncbi:MAG: hypothetical protein R6U95_00150 [Bacteroidales bacterium]
MKNNIISIILFLVCFFPFLLHAQKPKVLTHTVSLSITKQPISSILTEIEQKTNIRFFYSNKIFDNKTLMSFQSQDETIETVLKKLFPSGEIIAYIIDDKIILYTEQTKPSIRGGTNYVFAQKKKPSSTQKKTQKIYTKTQHKTQVLIHDTIIVSILDTTHIVRYDTIITEKKEEAKHNINNTYSVSFMPHMGFVYSNDIFRNHSHEFRQKTYSEKIIPSQLQFGMLTRFSSHKFSITSGISFSQKEWYQNVNFYTPFRDTSTVIDYSERIRFEVNRNDPPDWDTESDATYDTIFYITRTPIYKKDSTHTSYENINSASYMSLPLYISYKQQSPKKVAFTASIGASLHVLLNAKGFVITDEHNTFKPLEQVLSNYYASADASCGIILSINKNHGLFTHIGYTRTFTNVFKQDKYAAYRGFSSLHAQFGYVLQL